MGAAIAMACAGPMPAHLPGSDASTAQMRSMHIRSDRQGRGISRDLWLLVIEFLRTQGYARTRFDVIEGNMRARRFFALAGARVVARSPTGVEGVPIVTYEYGVRSAPGSGAGVAQR
jgi:ribosomal protein S18 acetylase RimI-like enzyme